MRTLRESLEYCRQCLLWILRQQNTGKITLTADQLARLRQTEQFAREALDDDDDGEGRP